MKKIKLKESDLQRIVTKILKEDDIDLDNYKAPFSAEDFSNWVDSEFDIEVLQMVSSKIQERLHFLSTMVGMATRGDNIGFKQGE
tara:strand:- start:371 stop:625 length:255 start_codon:yes stop_codon:yes gene_type:complete